MTRDVERLGQVFTPDSIVAKMVGLLENRRPGARILEPSCGDGAFLRAVPEAVGVEFDPRHAPKGALVGDFFALDLGGGYDSIVGNPPFVRFRDILPSTRALLPVDRYDRRTNLYVFFIDRCLDLLRPGGELVFINPRDFLKATHAAPLNARLFAEGSFTHLEDLGDAPIFPGHAPNCVILRWVKGRTDRRLDDGRVLRLQAGQIVEDTGEGVARGAPVLSDLCRVRVGGVSGMDSVFLASELGCGAGDAWVEPFAGSRTRDTRQPRYMLWADASLVPPSVLLPHKERLMARKARAFTEYNWWHWIRKPPPFLDRPAILVNAKTRRPDPFFVHQGAWVDGALLSITPKDAGADAARLCAALNAMDWRALGFVSGGRFLFGQRSLANAPLPRDLANLVG